MGKNMIYQVRTYNTLCGAKKYFEDKKDVQSFVKTVVSKTEEFRVFSRKNLPIHIRTKVSSDEIQAGVEIIRIDPAVLPEWRTFFGEEIEICNPSIIAEKND